MAYNERAVQIPFVIGITGNMDPYGYQDAVDANAPSITDQEVAALADLKRRIHSVFEWIRCDRGSLDPATGGFDETRDCPCHEEKCWQPLGLKTATLTVLSSLAPGIDTLVAEAALDLAESGAPIRVSAPLPFLADVYLESSTFNPENATEAQIQAKRDRYLKLCERTRNQNGFVESRDLFPVRLAGEEDLPLGARGDGQHATRDSLYARMERDLVAVDTLTGRPRRYLRYRAAGEYVANYCQLLIGIWDASTDRPDHDHLFASGSATIAENKRNGMSFRLLPVTSNFAWADNGPVLHIPVARKSNPRANSGLDGTSLTMLQPYDCRPHKLNGETHEQWDERWREKGDQIFRRIVARHAEFNEVPITLKSAEDDEIFGMLTNPKDPVTEKRKTAKELQSTLRGSLTDEGYAFALRQRATAGLRRRSANQTNNTLSPKREILLKGLLGCIAVAGLALALAEHWHPQTHTAHTDVAHSLLTHDPAHLVAAGLLVLCLFAIFVSGVLYHRHLNQNVERNRHDYRALAEGLRVQIYWNLAGLGRSVAANYMQRQRGELDWIRDAISSLNAPYAQWKNSFLQLGDNARLGLLKAIHERWTKKQADYFLRGATELLKKLHFWHTIAWGVAAGAVIHLALHAASKLITPIHDSFDHGVGPYIVAGIFLVGALPLLSRPLLTAAHRAIKKLDDQRASDPQTGTNESPTEMERKFRMWLAKHPARHLHKEEETDARDNLLAWIFGHWEIWCTGSLAAAVMLPIPHILQNVSDSVPSWQDWWIVCTGAMLLCAALSLAWAERNFYSEHSRQYRCMHQLYSSANRRLEVLLQRLTSSTTLRSTHGINGLKSALASAEAELQQAKAQHANAADIENLKSARTRTDTDLNLALDYDRITAEIHNILYNVGCEALDENAEWLILHRSRPLEPFMMG